MRQHIVTGGVLVCAVLWLASCQTLSDVVQAKTQGVGPRRSLQWIRTRCGRWPSPCFAGRAVMPLKNIVTRSIC